MDFKAINKVGIELEGAFANLQPDGQRHYDGSVHVPIPAGVVVNHTGEVVSAPLDTFAQVSDWVTRNYPVVHNQSCGMHVHVSFKAEVDYSRLMTQEFWTYFS